MAVTSIEPVHVIGGGLAGSEAAWQLACRGIPAVLHEMRPVKKTEAHRSDMLAELVCSNSLRSDDAMSSAIGLLHAEMRWMGSLVMAAADATRVPAGSALAVDRDQFSTFVQDALTNHPLITICREEIPGLPPDGWTSVIIATGPLTSSGLANALQELTGEDSLAFSDAIAPVIHRETIDFSKAWFQSRYDKGSGSDYINCPLTKDEYDSFIDALLAAEKMPFRAWEENTPYFEGCLPIEVMAERGRRTLAFGPMKPVGLSNPHDGGRRPHAVVQLRQDNALATLYNMVGFQTKLKHGEQVRVFRMIPGLQDATFVRLGGIHRNTFVNSPRILDQTLRLKARLTVRLAGQITGCEGYVESAAIGMLVGRFAAAERRGETPRVPPPTTALGALLNHITQGAVAETFQPMNINFGLFPPLSAAEASHRRSRRERQAAFCERALSDLRSYTEVNDATSMR